MRTSINIDEQVFLEAKNLAVESKRSFASVLEDALRVFLAKKKIEKAKISLITVNGKGLKHGINLDSNQSLNDIMGD